MKETRNLEGSGEPLRIVRFKSKIMLELNDWMLIGVVIFVASFFFAGIFAVLFRLIFDFMLIKRLESCEKTVLSGKGVDARADKKARLNEAALRAAELWQEGTKNGAKPDVGKLVFQLGTEYPDIALELPSMLQKLAKKFGVDAQGL